MKILCILTAYNDIDFLKFKKKFCDYHNLDLYVIDNYSDDGTWEWLRDNDISSHRFDTKDMFVLPWLQAEIVKTLRSLKDKPDWVIYNGADMFPITLPSIRSSIEAADRQDYNLMAIPRGGVFNTGEERAENPFKTYFYGCIRKANTGEVFIHKYDESVNYFGDTVSFFGIQNRVKFEEGFIIDYGDTKTASQRNKTYERRQKAWDANLMSLGHGIHYIKGNKCNWIWNKNDLINFKETPQLQYIQHLQEILS
jgi:hypothetical protein